MTKARALAVFSLLALFFAGTVHARTLRWFNNQVVSGAGSMPNTSSNGDVRLKSSATFSTPTTQVYLKISGWEQVYRQPSYLAVYVWDADNSWSTLPFSIQLLDVSSSETIFDFPLTVPAGSFRVEVRARCNQDTSYWAPGKTYTYNRLFEVYW